MPEIYVLLQPETRMIRYVGCARDARDRVKSHWKQRNSTYRSPVKDWLNSLQSPPEHEVLQVVSNEMGYAAEEYWTRLLLQIDTVDLLNRRYGTAMSDTTKSQISSTTSGVKKPWMCGPRGPVSQETRDKISASMKAYRQRKREEARQCGVATRLENGQG